MLADVRIYRFGVMVSAGSSWNGPPIHKIETKLHQRPDAHCDCSSDWETPVAREAGDSRM